MPHKEYKNECVREEGFFFLRFDFATFILKVRLEAGRKKMKDKKCMEEMLTYNLGREIENKTRRCKMCKV